MKATNTELSLRRLTTNEALFRLDQYLNDAFIAVCPLSASSVVKGQEHCVEQIKVIKEEREVLCQRVYDLMQMLELAGQAELSEKESETVCQRVRATRELLEEHEKDLRKRTIDLLFQFYMPRRNKRLGW